MAGRPLPLAVLMMIPEAWAGHEGMSEERKAFYEYHGCLMEPWDGPASIAFTDGTVIGAVLDRNGLRPSRYYVTKDDMVIMASEVGVLDIPAERVLLKERLHPGRIFLVDTAQGRIIDDAELKKAYAAQHPYGEVAEDPYPAHRRPCPGPRMSRSPITRRCCQRQQASATRTRISGSSWAPWPRPARSRWAPWAPTRRWPCSPTGRGFSTTTSSSSSLR